MDYYTSENMIIQIVDKVKLIVDQMITAGEVDPLELCTIGTYEEVQRYTPNTLFIEYNAGDSINEYANGEIISDDVLNIELICRNAVKKKNTIYDTIKENEFILSAIKKEFMKSENMDLGLPQVYSIYSSGSSLHNQEYVSNSNDLAIVSVSKYQINYEGL